MAYSSERVITKSNKLDAGNPSWSPLSVTGISTTVAVGFIMPMFTAIDNYYIKFGDSLFSRGKILDMNQFISDPTMYRYVAGTIDLPNKKYYDKVDLTLNYYKSNTTKFSNGTDVYKSREPFDVIGYGIGVLAKAKKKLTLFNVAQKQVGVFLIARAYLIVKRSDNSILNTYMYGDCFQRVGNAFSRKSSIEYLGKVTSLTLLESDKTSQNDSNRRDPVMIPERISYKDIVYDDGYATKYTDKTYKERMDYYQSKRYKIDSEYKLF